MRDLFTIHIGVHIFNDNKMLLLKNLEGKWGVVGGHLDHGESIENALEREIFEETGIKVESFELYKYFVKKTGFVILFLAHTKSQDVTLSGEHLDYRWMHLDNIDEIPLEYPEIKNDSIYLYSERINK